jgi:ribose 5-phosphate isomerase B
MHIYIGSDHGGYKQKELLHSHLQEKGYEVKDCGTYSSESTDYPDFALAVANAVAGEPGSRGILLCRSGEGMEIAANKVPKIRAALVWKEEVAAETRRDNDSNILVLPSDFISDDEALSFSVTFLTTDFSGEERHIRRLEKLHNIEHTRYES